MSVLREPSWASRIKIFFMHNWRCAGTSLNSLLSSNFGDKYVKIGTQFSAYGWPLYDVPEKLKLSEVRASLSDGCCFGGHLCSGVDALLPGEWDIWLNARDPIDRLSSGIMRFHAKSFRLPPGEYSSEQVRLNSSKKLSELFEGPLQARKNGVAKRLAGFSIAQSLGISSDVDLEELSCFSSSVNDADLLAAARRQLNTVKIVILPSYLNASLICIEKLYGLSPMLNLFLI